MKLTFKKVLGYANLGFGLLCLLTWLLNFLGWIGFGDPEAQLIMVPVCAVLGAVLLKPPSQTK